MKRIFWVDMEMTGLDPDQSVIIEFAAIITDLQFQPLATYEEVIFQPPEALTNLDDWNTRTHTASGLLAKIPQGKPLAQVETDAIGLIDAHFDGESAVLAGNSIHQDRKFIGQIYAATLREVKLPAVGC